MPATEPTFTSRRRPTVKEEESTFSNPLLANPVMADEPVVVNTQPTQTMQPTQTTQPAQTEQPVEATQPNYSGMTWKDLEQTRLEGGAFSVDQSFVEQDLAARQQAEDEVGFTFGVGEDVSGYDKD